MAYLFYTCHGPNGGCERKHRTLSNMAECLREDPTRSGFRCSDEYGSLERSPLTADEESGLVQEAADHARRVADKSWRIPGITTRCYVGK